VDLDVRNAMQVVIMTTEAKSLMQKRRNTKNRGAEKGKAKRATSAKPPAR